MKFLRTAGYRLLIKTSASTNREYNRIEDKHFCSVGSIVMGKGVKQIDDKHAHMMIS
jgi:hypothetical protein